MTDKKKIQDAIRWMQEEGSGLPEENHFKQLAQVSITALEKQIPKEFIQSKLGYKSCPVCERQFYTEGHVWNYCDKCGQRLKEDSE